MENLLRQVQSNRVLLAETPEEQVSLVQEYFERNARKKEDEDWLKDHKPAITRILEENNRDKMDFGSYRASVVVPNTSKFDNEKLITFLYKGGNHNVLEEVTQVTVNEEKLEQSIASGDIDMELLKEAAWVESSGTPRLTIKKVG